MSHANTESGAYAETSKNKSTLEKGVEKVQNLFGSKDTSQVPIDPDQQARNAAQAARGNAPPGNGPPDSAHNSQSLSHSQGGSYADQSQGLHESSARGNTAGTTGVTATSGTAYGLGAGHATTDTYSSNDPESEFFDASGPQTTSTTRGSTRATEGQALHHSHGPKAKGAAAGAGPGAATAAGAGAARDHPGHSHSANSTGYSGVPTATTYGQQTTAPQTHTSAARGQQGTSYGQPSTTTHGQHGSSTHGQHGTAIHGHKGETVGGAYQSSGHAPSGASSQGYNETSAKAPRTTSEYDHSSAVPAHGSHSSSTGKNSKHEISKHSQAGTAPILYPDQNGNYTRASPLNPREPDIVPSTHGENAVKKGPLAPGGEYDKHGAYFSDYTTSEQPHGSKYDTKGSYTNDGAYPPSGDIKSGSSNRHGATAGSAAAGAGAATAGAHYSSHHGGSHGSHPQGAYTSQQIPSMAQHNVSNLSKDQVREGYPGEKTAGTSGLGAGVQGVHSGHTGQKSGYTANTSRTGHTGNAHTGHSASAQTGHSGYTSQEGRGSGNTSGYSSSGAEPASTSTSTGATGAAIAAGAAAYGSHHGSRHADHSSHHSTQATQGHSATQGHHYTEGNTKNVGHGVPLDGAVNQYPHSHSGGSSTSTQGYSQGAQGQRYGGNQAQSLGGAPQAGAQGASSQHAGHAGTGGSASQFGNITHLVDEHGNKLSLADAAKVLPADKLEQLKLANKAQSALPDGANNAAKFV